MRLRFTALPSAFLMLHPNRLSSRPLARRKTANSRLVRRRPSRYTASYSDRRTRRAVRGKSCRGVSDARKTVAPLLAACRKYLPSTLALHSCAKSMLLMAAPHMRLKSAFRQRSLSSALRSISVCTTSRAPSEFRQQIPFSYCNENARSVATTTHFSSWDSRHRFWAAAFISTNVGALRHNQLALSPKPGTQTKQ